MVIKSGILSLKCRKFYKLKCYGNFQNLPYWEKYIYIITSTVWLLLWNVKSCIVLFWTWRIYIFFVSSIREIAVISGIGWPIWPCSWCNFWGNSIGIRRSSQKTPVFVFVYNIINRPTFTKFSLRVSQSPFRFWPWSHSSAICPLYLFL